MRMLLAAVCVLGLTGVLGGCAGVDQRMTRLTYMPTKAAAQTTGPLVAVAMPAEAHGLPRNAGGEPIVADVVGSGGKRKAGVVVVEPINAWVGNAVTAELRAAGVNAGLGLDAKEGRPVVKTEVTQLKNESKTQWSSVAVTSTIRLEFVVEKDGAKVGAVDAVGTAKADRAGEFKDVVHDAMERALRDALVKATPRLVELTRGS